MSQQPDANEPWVLKVDLPPMTVPQGEMSCQPSFDILFRYLDGAVETSQQAEIRQHLDGCHDCATVYNAQAELKRAVAESCSIDPPAGLADKVFAAVLAAEQNEAQMTTSGSDDTSATETETP